MGERQGELRRLRPQGVELGQMAARDHLGDLRGQILANARQIVEIGAARDHVGGLLAQAAQHAGGVAVGANAERILLLDLENVGRLVEGASDIFVARGRACPRRRLRSRPLRRRFLFRAHRRLEARSVAPRAPARAPMLIFGPTPAARQRAPAMQYI